MKQRDRQRFRRSFEAAKRQSVAQLLFKCARLVNERAIGRVREQQGVAIRVAHTALFPHIDVIAGTRLTDLAQALGISKQAVGQLVDELVGFGLLERRPDPDDGRARRVCYTKAGRRGLFEGLAVLRREEAEIEQALGKRRFDQLRRALLELEVLLERASTGA